MSTSWEPISDLRPGMIAVAVASYLSITSVILLLAFSALVLRAYYKTPLYDRQVAAETRGLKFLTSDYFPFFVNLLVCDLVQAIGFSLNVEWLVRNQYPSAGTTVSCTTQAVFIQFGDLGSAFGSLLVGGHITLIFVAGRRVSRKAIYGAIIFQWIVVSIMTLVGPVAFQRHGDPFYAWSGGWCWISQSYDSLRLWLHYFILFMVAATNLVLYGLIIFTIARHNRNGPEPSGVHRKLPVVMLSYPLVYILNVLPLSSFRIATMMGHDWGQKAQFGTGTIFCLSGFVNCVMYATTRKLVKIDKKQLSSGAWTIHRAGETSVAPAPVGITFHTTRRVSFSGAPGVDRSEDMGWGYPPMEGQGYELQVKGKDEEAGRGQALP